MRKLGQEPPSRSSVQANGPNSNVCAADPEMLRRTLIEEPVSRLAIWARRVAFFSLAASVLAIIIVRSGLLELRPALATFAGALGTALIALVLSFGALAVIWK